MLHAPESFSPSAPHRPNSSPRLRGLNFQIPGHFGTWPQDGVSAPGGELHPRADSFSTLERALRPTSPMCPAGAFGSVAAFAECRAVLARADAAFVHRSGELARLEAVAFVVEVFTASLSEDTTAGGGAVGGAGVSEGTDNGRRGSISSLRSSVRLSVISVFSSMRSSMDAPAMAAPPLVHSSTAGPAPVPFPIPCTPTVPASAAPRTAEQTLFSFRQLVISPTPALRLFMRRHSALAFAFDSSGLDAMAPARLAALRVPQSTPPLVLHDLLMLEHALHSRAYPSHMPTYTTHTALARGGGAPSSEGSGVWRTVVAYLAAVIAKEGEASALRYLSGVRDLARGRAQARRVMREGEERPAQAVQGEEGLPTARQNAMLRGVGLPCLY